MVKSLTEHPWTFETIDGEELATSPALSLHHKLASVVQIPTGDGELNEAFTMADILTTRISIERCQNVATFLEASGCFAHPHSQDASYFAEAARASSRRRRTRRKFSTASTCDRSTSKRLRRHSRFAHLWEGFCRLA